MSVSVTAILRTSSCQKEIPIPSWKWQHMETPCMYTDWLWKRTNRHQKMAVRKIRQLQTAKTSFIWIHYIINKYFLKHLIRTLISWNSASNYQVTTQCYLTSSTNNSFPLVRQPCGTDCLKNRCAVSIFSCIRVRKQNVPPNALDACTKNSE